MRLLLKKKTFAVVATLVAAGGFSVHSQANASNIKGVTVVASTIPANGDVNPYGVARVPNTIGSLTEDNILVSNFNDSANLQGTGTTIVQITPKGKVSLFAQIDANTLPGPCPGGVGLTTALSVLSSGWVIVGSLPTADGTSATAQAGCLLVLDSYGDVVETISGSLINGPWDMTALDAGSTADLFVSNVLNGTVAGAGTVVYMGTVVRLTLGDLYGKKPVLHSTTVIGSGFPERTDPAALVIGPTGLGLSGNADILYLADSLRNRIAAISDPVTRTTSDGTGTTVTQGGSLNDPLGLAVSPLGDILTVNGNNGFLIQTTPGGSEVAMKLLDNNGTPPGNGALFGLVPVPGHGLYYVDDATNTLNLFN